MATESGDENRKLKYAAIWAALGAATLAWSTQRAGKGLPVWPGILDASGRPPNAGPGAAETILFWPLAAYFNATAKPPASAQPASAQTIVTTAKPFVGGPESSGTFASSAPSAPVDLRALTK